METFNKQIFFSWIGNKKPDYVEFTIDVYKKVNPEFECKLIEVKDPHNIENEDFYNFLKVINKEEKDSPYEDFVKIYFKRSIYCRKLIKGKSLAFINDLFRFYLIYKHGGIYIDCDTFPVRPFDDNLLSKLNEQVKVLVPKHDNYFIVGEKGHPYCSLYRTNRILWLNKIRSQASKSYNNLKKKFSDCTIQFGERCFNLNVKDYYFDHYMEQSYLPENKLSQSIYETRENFYKLFSNFESYV